MPAALGLLLLAACSTERDQASLFAPDAVGVLVVDALLIVDQPLPVVLLSRTRAPDRPYRPEEAWEAGAAVTVYRRVGEDVVAEYPYVETSGPRAYVPTVSHTVLPEANYGVRVVTTDGEVLTAATVTPRRFAIDAWVLFSSDGQAELRTLKTFAEVGDGVYDAPENQLSYAEGLLDARFSGGSAAAFGAAGFQLSLFSLDPDAGYVIDPPFFEEEDFLDLPRSGSSPALEGEDGFVRLPWFSIYYDGRHKYKAYAVDRNWFDLVRTTPEGGGGFGFGGNLGDGVDPPLFHVEGGIGLFGSAAVDSLGFFINPVE